MTAALHRVHLAVRPAGFVVAGTLFVAALAVLLVPDALLAMLPAADGRQPTGVAVAALVVVAGLAAAQAVAYRPLLASTVVNRSATAVYVLPETLLPKVSLLGVVAAPVAAVVAARWETVALLGLGLLFVATLGALLETTRRLTRAAPADLPHVDQALENRSLFLAGLLGATAVVLWVTVASVVHEGSVSLEVLAYPVGVGTVVISMFTYYPFLLSWTFEGPNYWSDLGWKLLGFLAAGCLLLPIVLDRSERDAAVTLISGAAAALAFAVLMETLRRRALRQHLGVPQAERAS